MAPLRVAGCDPGSSSLDLVVFEDGIVADQHRFSPQELRADPAAAVRWLTEREPFALIAGPSGYGLPLLPAQECTDHELALMTLVRPDERGGGKGVAGFSALLRELCASTLRVIFLPGVIHLPTVPAHRKINRIDLGTPDKLCVAALALATRPADPAMYRACVVELGSAFTACVVIDGGRVVDGLGGTSGPCGWASGGAWDGELAYLLSPLTKGDLFVGGVSFMPDAAVGRRLFQEGLVKAVAGLRAITPFEEIVLAGRLLEMEPTLADAIAADLGAVGGVVRLQSLPGAWVKHAAQGAAVLADGLAGGRYAPLVERLRLREAAGTVLDWVCHPRGRNIQVG
jgi:predicted butyrate kinase (DUF1464 family)